MSAPKVDELAKVVAELGRIVRDVALGMQGLNVDEKVDECIRRAEALGNNEAG